MATNSPSKKKAKSTRLSGNVSHSNSTPSMAKNNQTSLIRQEKVPSATATAVQVESSYYHVLDDVVVVEDFDHASITGVSESNASVSVKSRNSCGSNSNNYNANNNLPRSGSGYPHSGSSMEVPISRRNPTVGGMSIRSSDISVQPNESAGREFLTQHHWPSGLQDALIKSCKKYPIRFVVVDDSGSMMTNDGHKLIRSSADKAKMINCTRWSELVCGMQFHAQLADAMQAPTEFRLLNNSGPITVGRPEDREKKGLSTFLNVLEDSPSGQTPICVHIREIISAIQQMESVLRTNNQKACVVIVTDGEATDGDIADTMKPLQHLPVWVVVRLCTDEDKIVEYWNSLDRQLELEIDVLDDLTGESHEVYAANPWLVYSDCMHRFREFGSIVREMGILDESVLSSEQMRIICNLLVIGNVSHQSVPHPDEDWDGFYNVLVANMNRNKSNLFWDPVSQKMKPPIDVAQLCSIYRNKANASKACSLS